MITYDSIITYDPQKNWEIPNVTWKAKAEEKQQVAAKGT